MDRNSTKGGDSFTGYTFILGVVFRIVCFGTGLEGFSVGLVETGTTRSNGILNSPQKITGCHDFNFINIHTEIE